MKTGIIYLATAASTGKCYVGQTVRTLRRRRQSHESQARRGSPRAFHAALRKYGADAFKWEVLEVVDVERLDEAETRYIALHRSAEKTHGYNIAIVGGNQTALGRKLGPFTDEHRRKISEAHQGKSVDPEHLQKLHEGRRKWKPTDDFKAAVSKAHRGRKHTEEARRNMSAAQKGRVFSEQHRKALSEAHKGQMGRSPTAEQRERIRAKLKGHTVSAETREKISAALKRRREVAL